MNILIDESIDRLIVQRLRQDGHHALYVAEMEPGISDDEVLNKARGLNALLVTADKDFGDLVFQRGQASSGVLLVRLVGYSGDSKAEILAGVLHDHGDELTGKFSVISPGMLRIRHQP